MLTGCFTALVTPFAGDAVDYEGLEKLARFQVENGISGILGVGTTGESPSLTWEEHLNVVEKIAKQTRGNCLCIAGTGSNNTKESMHATQHASKVNVDAVLLVDPYYNGPSSIEIRKEYISPVATAFPELEIIPYIIPGRTGTQLLPEDLALLNKSFKNVNTVKEATGSIENMRRTRSCCGADFTILSGDDGMTFEMMTDSLVKGAGVISVVSNVAPKAVGEMVSLLQGGKESEARLLMEALTPLFELVMIKTREMTPYGEVICKARNPIGIKLLMTVLGMPSGGCRQPLGKATQNGLKKVLDAVKTVWKNNPEILRPVEDFFDVNIEDRLNDPANWKGLAYKEYE
ncbi:MAG: 4-hydroxy-tetrahydrodipicolinate synthase [Desulfobacterales bacterium]